MAHLLIAGALLLSSSIMASAQISDTRVIGCELPIIRTGLRPTPEAGPTEVKVSLVVSDFLGVNDVDQQLDLDIYALFQWTDPRLAANAGCRFGRTEVWFPRIALLNSSNLRALNTNALNQVSVGEGGVVTYRQRFTGEISSYHNLSRFPFDQHEFKVEFAALEADVQELQFIADSENTWIAETLNIEGWFVHGVEIMSGNRTFRDTGEIRSAISLSIFADRNPGYFLYRVMLLLSFVVCMSWAIFWIPPSRFEFQIGLGATSMLTAIAFTLSIASDLPKLGYLTIMDKSLIWAVTLIFLTIVEALIAGLLVLRERENAAIRLDQVSRFVFPALLIGGWYFIIQTT
ncbi:hypothetical protein ACFE33_09045 [Falsihalocynthiibacter sp. SS001]|uniref:hypothetical protein n=1 Tax=Falsihalocynthiibacter sp. SS001 TaxID=3349698 RepID=UPI0036D292E4